MEWTREQILAEFKRVTAKNAGRPLGQRAFEKLIPNRFWRYKWESYGALCRDAGFPANSRPSRHADDALLAALIPFVRARRKFPTYREQAVERHNNNAFPSPNSLISHFGSQAGATTALLAYSRQRPNLGDIVEILTAGENRSQTGGMTVPDPVVGFGYVYLFKYSQKRYKVGKSDSPPNRHAALGRPEIIHFIRTDDPDGIEKYWHERFKERDLGHEMFALTLADVNAFKLRKKFM